MTEKEKKPKGMRGGGATRRRERCDGAATREALFAAAAEEFARKGYEAASVSAICQAAGANIALASRYFGTKEELYATVAQRYFGDLGAPLARLPDAVQDDASWRRAVEEWVDDMLFMTLPTEKAQRICAGLFRNEIVQPTRFHAKFRTAFGKPVYDALRRLLAMKIADEESLELWTTAIWAQVSVYALADGVWHSSFRPAGLKRREWAAAIKRHICVTLFESVLRVES